MEAICPKCKNRNTALLNTVETDLKIIRTNECHDCGIEYKAIYKFVKNEEIK